MLPHSYLLVKYLYRAINQYILIYSPDEGGEFSRLSFDPPKV